jgi:hypothetical protein
LRSQLGAAAKAARTLDEQAGVDGNDLLEQVEAALAPPTAQAGHQEGLTEGGCPGGHNKDDVDTKDKAGGRREEAEEEAWGEMRAIGQIRTESPSRDQGAHSNDREGNTTLGCKAQLELSSAGSLSQALQDVLIYVRERYCYCLYCGCRYDDDKDMGAHCPGLNEGDHE